MNCAKCGRDAKYVPNGTLTDTHGKMLCHDCRADRREVQASKPVHETTSLSDRPSDDTPLKEAVDAELRG